MERHSTLANFLLRRGGPPSPEALRAAGVAGYAYLSVPADHSLRAALRQDYLEALVRHEHARREIVPLLQAWHGAGVDALLFKGFHLAEFVYPARGARQYGDVDVLIRPESEALAARVAAEMGWGRDADPSARDHSRSHAAFGLRGPDGTALDVHRFPIHGYRWSRAPTRITRAVWEEARPRDWEGARIWEMQSVDSLLVGLVLQRAWGRESWGVKPRDPLDFLVMSERLAITRDDLIRRAEELDCSRTLETFLRRCDPYEGRLVLSRPTLRQRWGMDLAVLPERVPRRVERIPDYLVVSAQLTAEMPRLLRDVLRARRSVAGERPLPELLESLTPPSARTPESRIRRVRIVRVIRRLTRFIPTNPRGDCLVRSLAIYSALRREGWPVVFVTGVRRDGAAVVGHAWVELEGRVLPELREPRNPARYRETFRFPAAAPPAREA